MEEEDYYSPPEEKSGSNENTGAAEDDIVAVSVDSYKLEEGALKKHVCYIVQGQDSEGLFKVSRRFKEFESLRMLLSLMWPAFYIPKLPKKKAVVENI